MTDLALELADERLPEDIEITLYRVVQEALTNIERHAGLCKVQLRLQQRGGNVTLDIRDDGRGFDPQTNHFDEGIGLRNMRERIELLGGEFSLMSRTGEGTRLKARLPDEP
jgi:two-component system NarL family sensor kinase